MEPVPSADPIMLSGGSLLRTPGRSSNRNELEKANLSLWQYGDSSVELTAASAVSLLPQLQDFGQTSSIHFAENLVQPVHADFLQWQTHARKLIRAYASAAARFILKVAFVSWASRWQRFNPEAELPAQAEGDLTRQDDLEALSPEVHEKAQPSRLFDDMQGEEGCFQELFLDAQHRAELAERQIQELEERLRQAELLVESKSLPQVETSLPPQRLVQSLLAETDCQTLRLLLHSWRSGLCASRAEPYSEVGGKLEKRRATSVARATLQAWFVFVHRGATQLPGSSCRERGGTLALRAFLCWAAGLSQRRRDGHAADACSAMADRLGSAILRPAFGGWKAHVGDEGNTWCESPALNLCAFRAWQSETFGRHSWLEMRRARTSEERWRQAAMASLALAAWHSRAQQSMRLHLTLVSEELSFQRLVLGAWRLALPDLQPGATPPRARQPRSRPSPDSARPEAGKSVVTPGAQDVPARAQDSEALGTEAQTAPPTLLQQLHLHATRLLREKVKADGQPDVSSEPIMEDKAKGHPKYMPTPSKGTAPRKSSQPGRTAKTDLVEERPGPKSAPRRPEPAAGRGRTSPRYTLQGKAPVAQSRLKLQELQLPTPAATQEASEA